ncbi:ArsO family NAD(P)H-dependent flavin-containing monooxygenase [Intrasporangium flavum]|uniref:ArsO family NAD(P)H-dependent flavin-containing monooxygenase n=1 Tax=Intrasporangium flavum TaxID=1428657 RepID=UPI0009FA12F9|nr:ArsO family NAD(P)H-dependent flavin-containing monooxygenase [Intrasporangium flavum]
MGARPETAAVPDARATPAGTPSDSGEVDVVVIGGGQAGLATAFHLRRAGLVPGSDFVVLDAGEHPGGAWQHLWPSLHLFSPAEFSSLPGWLMPPSGEPYPPARHVVDYLAAYEQRYGLHVRHGVAVRAVSRVDEDPAGWLEVAAAGGPAWRARAVVSATGTWGRPFLPHYPGQDAFAGRQLHSAHYAGPEPFAGARVVVVGGGNTAAQLLAELSQVAATRWVTLRPPRFLPDDVDGRVLFDVATARRRALDAGRADPGGVAGLGDVVMVPSVRAARDRGVLVAEPMFERLTPTGVRWADGTTAAADAVVWCTGFRPDLRHLAPLRLTRDGTHPATSGTRATSEPRLHLVGYGDWTGPASATLIGVGRTARDAVATILGRRRGRS